MGLLDNFKKNRAGRISALQSATTSTQSFDDGTYYPERDSEGNANVTIRFLPQKDVDAIPFVTYFSHKFKGDDGRWLFMDLCPTTVGKKCPICDKNSTLWNSGSTEKQNIARSRKRKKEYVANILVVKDPKSPEKEGKVFLFKFGASIYEKIKNAINPKYEDENALNPFDLWEGADFYLRIRKDPVKKQITYEDSKFAKSSPLFDGDEVKLEAILGQCKDLSVFKDESKLMGEEEALSKANSAYCKCVPTASSMSTEAPVVKEAEAPKKEAPVFPEAKDTGEIPFESNEEEDPLAAFKQMVDEIQF